MIFSGKVAVVTGGTRGIGRAVSLMYLREGARVFALYARSKEGVEELTAQAAGLPGELQCLRGDLTQGEMLENVSQQILSATDSIHFLVHCAASGVHKPALELSGRNLRWTFEINVFAFHDLLLKLKSRMVPGGRILGLTSQGATRSLEDYASVGASKGALDALFRHYAVEFAKLGISVNLICPGLVQTEALKAFKSREERIQKAEQTTPSGRLASVEDVAQVARFLSSPESAQIVGQTFVVDGGRSLLA